MYISIYIYMCVCVCVCVLFIMVGKRKHLVIKLLFFCSEVSKY